MKKAKRLVCLLLTLAMALSLAACGSPAQSESTPGNSQDPAPEQTTSMQDGYFDPWDYYFGH